MNNVSEVVESLIGIHKAQEHTIEALSDLLIEQNAELTKLRTELQEMINDVEYWKYQLDAHGIAITLQPQPKTPHNPKPPAAAPAG